MTGPDEELDEEVPMPPDDFGKEWLDSEFHINADDLPEDA